MKNREKSNDGCDNVKQRLLSVAEKLFAEKGFERTSVRDITQLAQCNVAAVNYHFGGKDLLYQELFHKNISQIRQTRIDAIKNTMDGSTGQATLEILLQNFAKAFIESMRDKEGGVYFMNIIMREMLDPHLPRNMFLEDYVLPITKAFEKALVILVPQLSPSEANLCTHSVIAQLYHAIRAAEFYRKIDQNAPILDVSRVIDHIVNFSKSGIVAAIKKI